MFGDLVVNQYIFFFQLKQITRRHFIQWHSCRVLDDCKRVLKHIKGEDSFAFRLAAGCCVGTARTLATTANAVLMRDSTEAEIQFCLDLYCVFSPS